MKTTDYNLPLAIKTRLTAEQAFYFRLIPFKWETDTLYCLTDLEKREQKTREWKALFDFAINTQVISTSEFSAYFYRNYHRGPALETLRGSGETDLLQQVLTKAKSIGSSDIHIEIYRDTARIRLRLDGKLKESFTLPTEQYPLMVNKIKVKARLDIAEKRLPQDGRIALQDAGNPLELRVSVMPTLYGEKIVLRLLGQHATKTNLSELGFTPEDLRHYRKAVHAPQGLLLISGPTGSGKTTTLYATLKELNTVADNILTIEDPIEYTLEGVNQVQVNEAIGLTFPNALRSFLRQDPDVIMVGEIRDEATAQIAIRAALTGHRVLATIHTNSAWGTIARLTDMGIPPFLIADTLKISVAQRLVRLLCNHCKQKHNKPHPLMPQLKNYYGATGCEKCHFTGYKGRTALYEMIPINSKIAAWIHSQQQTLSDTFRKKQKWPSLYDKALTAVKEGQTAPDEILTVL